MCVVNGGMDEAEAGGGDEDGVGMQAACRPRCGG